MEENKEVYPLSTILKIKGFYIKDLPVSKPTYYDLVLEKRKSYEYKKRNIANFLGISLEELNKSLKLEKKILDKKRRLKK